MRLDGIGELGKRNPNLGQPERCPIGRFADPAASLNRRDHHEDLIGVEGVLLFPAAANLTFEIDMIPVNTRIVQRSRHAEKCSTIGRRPASAPLIEAGLAAKSLQDFVVGHHATFPRPARFAATIVSVVIDSRPQIAEIAIQIAS